MSTAVNMNKARSLWEFPGGILPLENKVQSLTGPIQPCPVPALLRIPTSQPGHQQANILVEVGDHVLKGQVIARGEDSSGLVCHASSSGLVEFIGPIPVPNNSGLPESGITICTDGEDQWLEGTKRSEITNYLDFPQNQLIDIIAEAGISGLGGAGFPSHLKISNRSRDIHTLIINACECEPFITADDALMRERADEIILGIMILKHILKPKTCLLAIEDNKPEALSALIRARNACNDGRIEIVVLPTRYPSGAEKQLIQILTGTEIPGGSLAIHNGFLCQNIATVYAIARAVSHGEPLISRITTLTGAALGSPCNMEVLIGSPIAGLLESRRLNHDIFSNLIMGGSLMGISLPSTEFPIIKTTTCLIATTQEELPTPPPAQACIRCGYCAEVCPVSLLPQQLYWFARGKEHEKAQQHNVMDCIECGACAYVCPSHIPLVQYYRASKASIRQEQALHTRAGQSQQRFENREVRIEKDRVEEDKRREERAELVRKNRAAKANDGSKEQALDPIQAALARVKAKKEQQNKGKNN